MSTFRSVLTSQNRPKPVGTPENSLVEECWRHAKAIGAWGAGTTVLDRAGVTDTPGVVIAGSGTEAFAAVTGLLANHRVWERFPVAVG
jgi:catalase